MSVTPNKRLLSLDALRGFDMFWIIGGAGVVGYLAQVVGLPDGWVAAIGKQFTHVEWEGFHFYDLIFPLFVFMSGVTVPYSVLSKKAKGIPVSELQIGTLRRSFLIVLIGFSFSVFKFQWESLRLYQVLWLIGMSYLIGSSVALHVGGWRDRVIVFFSVLLTYNLVLVYMPFPGKGDVITPDNNIAAWLDRNLIKTSLYRGTYDPEGTIRVISAGMLGLLGAMTGTRIKSYGQPETRCAIEMAGAGVGCLLIGWIWSLFFPIIKDLWTPSFVLWAGGWSLLLMSAFYYILDVKGLRWLGFFFVPIGMNAITVYAAQWYLPLEASRDFFFAGLASHIESPAGQQLVLWSGLVAIQWILLYGLYRKKIFLRV